MVKLQISEWQRQTANGKSKVNVGPRITQVNGTLYLVVKPTGSDYQMIPFLGATIRGTITGRGEGGKSSIQVEANGQTLSNVAYLELAMCPPTTVQPVLADCFFAESGALYTKIHSFQEMQFFSTSTIFSGFIWGVNSKTQKWSVTLADAKDGAEKYIAQLELQKARKVENEKKEAQKEAQKQTDEQDKVRRFVASANRGTTMFCESGRLLTESKSITSIGFTCDLTGKGFLSVRELLSNGWVIVSEIRTPRSTMAGTIAHDVSLQMRKQ